MARLKQLIHEINRPSLWQVLGIYVVGNWLALQAVDALAGALNLFLLIIGLPIVRTARERGSRTAPGST